MIFFLLCIGVRHKKVRWHVISEIAINYHLHNRLELSKYCDENLVMSILSTSRIKPIFKEISFITWQKIQFYVNLTWNRNNTFSFGLWAEIKSILANLLNKKNSILREFHVKSWNFFNLLSKIAIILLISA